MNARHMFLLCILPSSIILHTQIISSKKSDNPLDSSFNPAIHISPTALIKDYKFRPASALILALSNQRLRFDPKKIIKIEQSSDINLALEGLLTPTGLPEVTEKELDCIIDFTSKLNLKYLSKKALHSTALAAIELESTLIESIYAKLAASEDLKKELTGYNLITSCSRPDRISEKLLNKKDFAQYLNQAIHRERMTNLTLQMIHLDYTRHLPRNPEKLTEQERLLVGIQARRMDLTDASTRIHLQEGSSKGMYHSKLSTLFFDSSETIA